MAEPREISSGAAFMRILIDIGLVATGFVLGWLLPAGFVPESWRPLLGVFLIGAGIGLAVLGFR
jgi:hypothetical protein